MSCTELNAHIVLVKSVTYSVSYLTHVEKFRAILLGRRAEQSLVRIVIATQANIA